MVPYSNASHTCNKLRTWSLTVYGRNVMNHLYLWEGHYGSLLRTVSLAMLADCTGMHWEGNLVLIECIDDSVLVGSSMLH